MWLVKAEMCHTYKIHAEFQRFDVKMYTEYFNYAYIDYMLKWYYLDILSQMKCFIKFTCFFLLLFLLWLQEHLKLHVWFMFVAPMPFPLTHPLWRSGLVHYTARQAMPSVLCGTGTR